VVWNRRAGAAARPPGYGRHPPLALTAER
jgi:hypothetical protein